MAPKEAPKMEAPVEKQYVPFTGPYSEICRGKGNATFQNLGDEITCLHLPDSPAHKFGKGKGAEWVKVFTLNSGKIQGPLAKPIPFNLPKWFNESKDLQGCNKFMFVDEGSTSTTYLLLGKDDPFKTAGLNILLQFMIDDKGNKWTADSTWIAFQEDFNMTRSDLRAMYSYSNQLHDGCWHFNQTSGKYEDRGKWAGCKSAFSVDFSGSNPVFAPDYDYVPKFVSIWDVDSDFKYFFPEHLAEEDMQAGPVNDRIKNNEYEYNFSMYCKHVAKKAKTPATTAEE